MQQEVRQINEPLIEVTNYREQNVQILLTPSLMFINHPIKINNKKYYKLIIWLDYKKLNQDVIFKQDLLVQNLKFELMINNNNQLKKVANDQVRERLWINFDDLQRRIISNDNDYFVYLIEDKDIANEEINFNYQLTFSSGNNQNFLNEKGVGINKGKILLKLKSKLNNNQVEMPEIIAFLATDNWVHKNDVVYEILSKKYYLKTYPLNYINLNNPLIFTVDIFTKKERSLAILSQEYLTNIINDFENNLINNDFLINSIDLKASEKLDSYYENKIIDYSIKYQNNQYNIFLTSKWKFDYDKKKVLENNQQDLIFNPLVKTDQWIEIDFALNGKNFMIKNFITTQNKVEIVEQARILNYSFDKEFVFTTKDKLTYFDYSRVLNEYS